jgi:long-chain acyl-CoA synthetase
MLADHLKMKEGSLPSVKMLRYGASPISESLCSEAMAIFSGAEISQAYGQTELSPTVTLLNHRDHRTGGKLLRSAGRPIPGVEIKIRDGAGRELSSGEVGEVHVRSDGIMAGYWLQPALTEATIVEGWLRTGDAGYCDENGYLFLVDRVKDMIVSGGENVYSAEVENAIELHPEVRQCAVIGLPDDKWGERVHAVVRRVGGSELTAASLVDHCRAHIAGYKCPRTIEFWEEPLPTSGAGKILKTELRKIVTTRDVNSA